MQLAVGVRLLSAPWALFPYKIFEARVAALVKTGAEVDQATGPVNERGQNVRCERVDGEYMRQAIFRGNTTRLLIANGGVVDHRIKPAEAIHLLGYVAGLRNAGQVCIAPTRFLVQEQVYEEFVDRFVAQVEQTQVGDGLDSKTRMGPLANERRVTAMETLIADAVQKGARLRTGGQRIDPMAVGESDTGFRVRRVRRGREQFHDDSCHGRFTSFPRVGSKFRAAPWPAGRG